MAPTRGWVPSWLLPFLSSAQDKQANWSPGGCPGCFSQDVEQECGWREVPLRTASACLKQQGPGTAAPPAPHRGTKGLGHWQVSALSRALRLLVGWLQIFQLQPDYQPYPQHSQLCVWWFGGRGRGGGRVAKPAQDKPPPLSTEQSPWPGARSPIRRQVRCRNHMPGMLP